MRTTVLVWVCTVKWIHNSRFQTRTSCMLVLDIDYRPQCVAHAHQVRDLHSMVGRGARINAQCALLGLELGYERITIGHDSHKP